MDRILPLTLAVAAGLALGCRAKAVAAKVPSAEAQGAASGPVRTPPSPGLVGTPLPPVATGDPRFQGLLRRQSEIEEGPARTGTHELPSGQPAFTQDFVAGTAAIWTRLLGHLKGKPNVQFLEIGSFEGRSAIWFSQNILTGEGSSITCIDLFGDRLDRFFDHNVKATGVDQRVHKIKAKSQEALRQMPRQPVFDFVYIDGCHLATCTLADAVLSWDLVKVGGIVMFDDYGWNLDRPPAERPKTAVDAFLETFAPHVEVIERGYTLALRKKSEAY